MSNMSNFIRRKEIKMTNEPLKVRLPLLGRSIGMDKLPFMTNTGHFPVTKITVMGTSSPPSFGAMERFKWPNLGQLKYSLK